MPDSYIPLRINRCAPRQLAGQYPELWNKLSRQRFAWLQVPWLVVFLVIFLPRDWPTAIVLVSVWLWQRKNPNLLVCRSVEMLILLYFTLLVFGLLAFVKLSLAGPFAPIFLIGTVILLYDASARSWHYLFNYMCLYSNDFCDIALANNWISEIQPRTETRRWSVFVAIAGTVLSILSILILSLISSK